jgi:hypothetical protein
MANYVLHGSGFRVCIYDVDHPHPHCHVIYANEDETVVNLPALTVKHGPPLTRQIRAFLFENLETLGDEFDKRHPKK